MKQPQSEVGDLISHAKSRTLGEALDVINANLRYKTWTAVVFSNGIPSSRFRRLLALRRFYLMDYDSRRERGETCASEIEDTEKEIEAQFESGVLSRVAVVSDAQWRERPLDEATVRMIEAASAVYVIERPKQDVYTLLAKEIERGSSPYELVQALKLMVGLWRKDVGKEVYCNEYEGASKVIRALLSRKVVSLINNDRQPQSVRMMYCDLTGVPYDVLMLYN